MLSALLCGMLVVAVAMTTNIGTLVTEKMAMQNAIDLAAYAGAATQAAYLNDIRSRNEEIWQTAKGVREIFQHSAEPIRDPGVGICPTGDRYPSPNCLEWFHASSEDSTFGLCTIKSKIPGTSFTADGAENKIKIAQSIIDGDLARIKADNAMAAAAAAKAAADTANANYPGLGNTGIFGSRQGAYPMGIVEMKSVTVDVSYFGYCVERPPLFGSPRIHVAWSKTKRTLTAWTYKVESGDVLFAAKAENAHPTDSFMDLASGYFMNPNDRCYGGNSQKNGRCGLNVYAAAMPFYGKLGSQECTHGGSGPTCGGHGSNDDRWNRGSSGLFEQADHPGDLDADEPQSCHSSTKGYCNYRVRMVGIFENDLNWVGGAGQAQNGFVPSWAWGKVVH